MSNTSIRCRVGTAVVGATCFLLGVALSGCSEPGASPKSAAQGAAKGRPATAPADAAVKPAVAADTPEPAASATAKTGPKGDAGTVEVGACDGGKAVEVPKGMTGQPLADSLMDQWTRNHPDAQWVAEEKERHTLQPAADNSDLLKGGQGKGDTYGNFTERDLLTWARETEKFAAEGSRIFHSADELGSMSPSRATCATRTRPTRTRRLIPSSRYNWAASSCCAT
jgi:hypothetical protein